MTGLLRIAAAFGALVPLAACVVGPDYHAPAVPAGAEAPLVSFNPAVETPGDPSGAWWHLYNDPLLDKLVQEALAANYDLAAAEANLSASRAMLEYTRTSRYPQTGFAAAAVRGHDPVTDEIEEIDRLPPKSIWLFDDLLDVSYEIDLFGRVQRSIEASRADAEAEAAARDSLKITVAAETTRAYAQICALGEQIVVAHHSFEVVSHEEQIVDQRREAGAGSEFDVVRAQELVAQAQAVIPPLLGLRRAALFQLAAMLGRSPSGAPAEVEACAKAPQLTALIPVGDGASLLKRRPDVRQADRQLAGAIARVGVATADLYPRISLIGFYGGAAPNFPDLFKEAGLAWGLGPSVQWSFPNQSGPRALVHRAEANSTAALAKFDSVVLQALKETEQALASYSSELDHRQALVIAQDEARKAFNLAQGQYLAGSISTIDLLNSEQNLVASDATIAESDAALAQDQIAVFKALGGGW